MSSTAPRSPFRSRGFITACIGVGIIVLAGIIVLVTTLTRTDNNAVNTPTPTSSAVPSGNATDASICGLPGFDTTNTLTTAPDSKWELVGTLAAPSAPDTSGPGVVGNDGFRSCYAHTAQGALFAAINYGAMSTDSRLAREVSKRALVPGPGQDAVLARGESGQTSQTPSLRAQVVGFKISSYTAQEAVVDLVLQISSSGQMVSVPTVLQWSAGEWKGVTDLEGNIPLQPSPIDNLGGYIPWSGA